MRCTQVGTLWSSGPVLWVVLAAGVVTVALAGPVPVASRIESPLRAVGSTGDESIARLVLNEDVHQRLDGVQGVMMRDLPLGGGHLVNVELWPVEIFAADARVVVGTADGDVAMRRPQPRLYAGHVVGRPESSVYLSFSGHGADGFVRLDDKWFVISSGPQGGDASIVAYDLTGLPPGRILWKEFRCFTDMVAGPPPAKARAHEDAVARTDAPCRIADVAVETDWEFTGWLFGGDTEASAAYATTLMGAISEIYFRVFNVRLRISYLRVWGENDDPWDQPGAGDQLVQFREYWNANMTDVSRHVAHFLSGRPLGGGVAYVPGLCNTGWDYGLSGNLGGFFPHPLVDYHWQNWDPYVVAHEMGHNFGAPHTHCVEPKIDRCADENGGCWDGTRLCQQGTIMSYCHTCPGGMTNIALEFHDRIISEEVLPYLDSTWCDLVPRPPVFIEQPQDRGNCVGGPIELAASACGDVGITYQWRLEGVEVPGAVGETFLIESVVAEDAGVYDVVVSDGGEPQISESALVTVFSGGCSGDTNRDGTINVFDAFCILDGIAGDFSTCVFADLDIAPCGGNGVLNVYDVFAVLGAIAGVDPCCEPSGGGVRL